MSVMAEKRYAILIASSSYPDEPGLKGLRCPENDVDALDAVLRSPDFGGFTETFVFKNRPNHEVLEKIETVLGEAGRNDLVLIYFSGHGKLNPAGQLCLATANTKLRALGSTSIQAAEIKSYFDLSSSRKKIFLLDCCYSGAVGKAFARGGVDDQLQLMSRGQGTFIMTASTGIEVAVEKEGDEYGLFTKHLVQGIRSGEADKDGDGFVDMQELYEHVHEKVGAEGAQKPMQWGLGVKGRLVIARSGKQSRQEMEQELYRLAAEGLLTSRIVHEAIGVLHLSRKALKDADRQRLVLIEQLSGKKIGSAEFIEQWMGIADSRKSRLPLLVLVFILLCMGTVGGVLLLRQDSVQKASGSPRKPAQETLSPVPVVQSNQPPEQTNLPGAIDAAHEQDEGITEQSATIPVSPPVVPLPKEEPEQPFVVVDHPKTKKVVAVSSNTPDKQEPVVLSVPEQDKEMTDPTTGMEFVSVPKGCFQMGSNEYNDEKPVHEVCVDGFWMGKYEVTQGQWQKIMGDNPAGFKKGDKYPVEKVSWEDTQKFITQLNKKSGKEYRLPTEAEWEYAARAKSSYKYSGGDDLNAVAWYDGNSGDSTHPVGQKKANDFGLYDMSGNVWEWCADWYDGKYYASSPQENPTGPDSGADRVLRGGGWIYHPVRCRSVLRIRHDPGDRRAGIGFRLVLPFQAAGS